MLVKVSCDRCKKPYFTETPKAFGKRTLQRMAEKKIRKGENENDVERWVLEVKKSWRCEYCAGLQEMGHENTKRKNRSRAKKKKFISLDNRLREVEKITFGWQSPEFNIYDFDTIYHWIGWPIFLIFAGYIGKKVYRAKTKKIKITKNYLAEIRAIFKEWQLNMYASTGAYVVGFYLVKEAISKWVEPKISEWIIVKKLLTIAVVCFFVGIGFYLDGLITSSLKTPLQRLSIKIENADIDEKVKKDLLSKTQQVNELFKETLKRFGLLAVVGILTKLIEVYWNKHVLSYLSYAVPILGALKIIWDIDKTLKKIKRK